MEWEKIYQERKCTADEAVRLIHSGDRVVLAHCIAEPPALAEAMVANKHLYKDVVVSHMGSGGKAEYTWKENSDHFRFEGWMLAANTVNGVAEGQGDFVPVFFHELPKMIKNDTIPVDVLMVMVSPPDKHGYCSVGVSSDYTMAAAQKARVILAQINEEVPYTYGETCIHVSQMAAIVEENVPLIEVQPAVIGEEEEKIGKYCASLIEDGATLQLGIGAIPNAVLAQLKNKKNLGIHSELIVDGIVDLVKAGVINGCEKSIDKGKIIGTFVMGTKALYQFVDHNPMVEVRQADYVNDPVVISRSSKLVSVNSAIQVDFMGQVVADSIGIREISGVGGQVDFVRGAAMSQDQKGISIIAFTSTLKGKDGRLISKIVPYINEGAAVTTSRNDVDYIITEYGIAKLKGKNLKERARALITIAHPDFRSELQEAFEKRFLVKF